MKLAYSVKEAAAQLGICERLIRELIKADKIRALKVGGRVIIPHGELERLLAPPSSTGCERGEIAMVS